MAIIHEDKKTNLIRKLLEKGKSLSYIRERFSEEFEDSLELIHIYNVLRTIAQEQYLERKKTELSEHKFFPELRFVLKHEPTSEVVEERSSQNWRVLLNSRGKFLIYHRDSFVGETDFGMPIYNFELHGDYLVVLTDKSFNSIYLPAFKTSAPLPYGSDKPISLDREYIYFREFRQKYILDELGGIHLGFVEKGKFEEPKKTPKQQQEKVTAKKFEEDQINKTQEIEKIEIVYLLSNGDLNKLEIEFDEINVSLNDKKLEKLVDFDKKRVRFLDEDGRINVKLLSIPVNLMIDSTQKINHKIKERYTPYIERSHPEAIVNQTGELVFLNDYDNTTKVVNKSMNYNLIVKNKFLSVHQIGSTYYILTASDFYDGFKIYEWNGSLSSSPELIYQKGGVVRFGGTNIVSADLHVYLKNEEKTKEPEITSKTKKQQESTQTKVLITQKYTEVEYLRLIRDMLLVASRDRQLKAWTLEGEYLGVVAEIKDFVELKDFIKPRNNALGFVIDDTLVFIGDNWLSGSRGYSDHVNICLGGIPEFNFKEQFLKVYSSTLSEAYQKIVGDKPNATKGRKG